MKIAVLVDFPYWEGNVGTAVRMESLCQSLAKICDLTVVSSVTLHSSYQSFADDAPYRLVDRRVLKEIDRGLTGIVYPGVRTDRLTTVRSVAEFCRMENFDAVLTPYFNRDWMAEHVPPEILRIVDTIDCQSQRTRSFAAQGLTPTFPMTAAAEGKQLDRYDIALAISDEDHDEFTQITSTPVITAPFRLPVNDLYRVRANAKELLFIAAKSDVNDMSLAYLLRDVLPLVDRPVRLNIVGNVTVPEYRPANTKVICHKRIEDLREIYSQVDLALNPTYAGGGVKTKTLEAIAHGVPVISSDEGARGLHHLLPEPLIVNDKERFAYVTGLLLDDNRLRGRLSQQMIANLASEAKEDWLDPFLHMARAARAAKLEAAAAR